MAEASPIVPFQTKSFFRTIRLAILGKKHVGKTSIVMRLIHGIFNPTYVQTMDFKKYKKEWQLRESDQALQVQLSIIDTGCYERERQSILPWAHGIMLVYDVTRDVTFDDLPDFLREIAEVNENDPVIVIVGNKNDLIKHKEVDSTRAEEFARNVGVKHFEVSAKTGHLLHEAFGELVEDTYHDLEDKGLQIDSIRLSDKEDVTCTEGCCCSLS